MKTLTQRKANAMTPNEQLNAYCSHSYNLNAETHGLTVYAQRQLYNDWRSAIFNWIWSLPA